MAGLENKPRQNINEENAMKEGHHRCAWCGNILNTVIHKCERIGTKFYHNECLAEKQEQGRQKRARRLKWI